MLVIERIPEHEQSRNMVAEVQFADENGVIPDDVTFPRFALNTYECLKSSTSDNGNHVYNLVNNFFTTLTLEQQRILFDYYCEMKALINSANKDNFTAVRKGPMTDLTTRVMTHINIAAKTVKYIEDINVPFPPFPDELREHDTAKMTFRRPEYVDLTAVSLFSKIMSPIWGDIINVLKIPTVSEFDKEVNCFLIVLDVLRSGAYEYIYNRFASYLRVTVNKALTSSDPSGRKGSSSFSLACNGFVVSRFQEMVYAITLVKKFVIHDVWSVPNGSDDPPNIMTYAYDVLIKTGRSKITNMRDRAQFLERFALADSSSGTTDNTTLLDHGSRSSRVPVDYKRIAVIGAKHVLDWFVVDEGLDPEAVKEALAFHEDSIITPNVLNRAVGASLFSMSIGGSDLLHFFKKDLYTYMVVVSQLYLAKCGFDQLVPFLSCASDDSIKTGPADSMASRVAHAMQGSREYRECQEHFPASAMTAVIPEYRREEMGASGKQLTENVGIATQLTRIQTWICMYTHWFNVSMPVWRAMDVTEENMPLHETVMPYKEHIMREMCAFFLVRHKYRYMEGFSVPTRRRA